MPSYYDDPRYIDSYGLMQHHLRNSHRPLRCIVNEGKLIIDERSLENRFNTVIYNSPGSTMWIEHRGGGTRTVECRGCFRRREHCYGGYCSKCSSLRPDVYRRSESEKLWLLDYPERRAIAWR